MRLTSGAERHFLLLRRTPTTPNVVGYRYWCTGDNGGWGKTSAYIEINDFHCS
jgi:hypothetical protein